MAKLVRLISTVNVRGYTFEKYELYSNFSIQFLGYYYRVTSLSGTVYWFRLDYIMVDRGLYDYLEIIYNKSANG